MSNAVDAARIADLERQVHLLSSEVAFLEWQALYNSCGVIASFLTILFVFIGWARPGA
jgi:hypothetical protein